MVTLEPSNLLLNFFVQNMKGVGGGGSGPQFFYGKCFPKRVPAGCSLIRHKPLVFKLFLLLLQSFFLNLVYNGMRSLFTKADNGIFLDKFVLIVLKGLLNLLLF